MVNSVVEMEKKTAFNGKNYSEPSQKLAAILGIENINSCIISSKIVSSLY